MIAIKRVDDNDYETVAEIIRESFEDQAKILNINENEYPDYVAFETPKQIENSIRNGEALFIAFNDSEIIGTIRFSMDKKQLDKGYIGSLAVLPEYRGNSYGKVLMKFAEYRLKKLGVKTIELVIVAEFKNLRKFYEEQGYIAFEEKSVASLPFPVLFMEKSFISEQ